MFNMLIKNAYQVSLLARNILVEGIGHFKFTKKMVSLVMPYLQEIFHLWQKIIASVSVKIFIHAAVMSMFLLGSLYGGTI